MASGPMLDQQHVMHVCQETQFTSNRIVHPVLLEDSVTTLLDVLTVVLELIQASVVL